MGMILSPKVVTGLTGRVSSFGVYDLGLVEYIESYGDSTRRMARAGVNKNVEREEMMSKPNISLDMTVAEALRSHPQAARVLASFNLGGCAHCMMGRTETLAEVCEAYEIDPDTLVKSLESLFEPEGAPKA